jgi:DNA-binding CsgD family transcriptional regulator
LLEVLERALETREPQRIGPARSALAEAAWLAGNLEEARSHAESAISAGHAVQSWELGDLFCWAARAGKPIPHIDACGGAALPDTAISECAGDASTAAAAYGSMGMPFEQAVALCGIVGESRAKALQTALTLMISIDAQAGIARVRQLAVEDGIILGIPVRKRGPYGLAKLHPLGLSAKEEQVWSLLRDGASNQQIADTLHRSVRTIEHHVSSLIDKMQVKNRYEAALISSGTEMKNGLSKLPQVPST